MGTQVSDIGPSRVACLKKKRIFTLILLIFVCCYKTNELRFCQMCLTAGFVFVLIRGSK